MTTIVMTGGTSGLGAVAATQFRGAGAQLLLGARGQGEAHERHTLPLDLTDLRGVRAFAAEVENEIGASTIDALVLNAGGYARGRTAEGYDATFVLNHLAHYLLARLLWPRLSDGGILLLTTSGTHDPAERTVVPPPRHADARRLARPELDPDLDKAPRTAAARAYSSAKLCVVLTARALAARADGRARGIRVVAYDPGPTPGTGLVRAENAVIRFVWVRLATPLRMLMRGANTVEEAGRALADLALGRARGPEGRIYAALRRGKLTWLEPSNLARRDDLMEALWRDSADLVGLPAQAD